MLRAVFVYFLLLILFRISGKRTINDASPFGLILIFLVSGSVADALKGEDHSTTNSVILASTLVFLHLVISMLKQNKKWFRQLVEDHPTLLVKDGEEIKSRMKKHRVSSEDILAAARKNSIKRMQDIKYAILEIDGSICVIKKE